MKGTGLTQILSFHTKERVVHVGISVRESDYSPGGKQISALTDIRHFVGNLNPGSVKQGRGRDFTQLPVGLGRAKGTRPAVPRA